MNCELLQAHRQPLNCIKFIHRRVFPAPHRLAASHHAHHACASSLSFNPHAARKRLNHPAVSRVNRLHLRQRHHHHTVKIPSLPKCDGAIHIVGDSMYPLLKSGDIILYKQISTDINNVIYGEMYLLSYDIDGDDYIVVKYIRKSPQGEPFITLASENPEHASKDINCSRVTALALVKASVRINCMI